jgi:hypothetical protein
VGILDDILRKRREYDCELPVLLDIPAYIER